MNTTLSDFNAFLHQLRTDNLRQMPRGASTLLSAGCSGKWYFDWILENYGPVARHIGVEFYSPRPADLPPEVEWIANTVSDMRAIGDEESDLVFSGQNIEHLWPEEITGFLLEANRVLKPGGVIVIDSPNRLVTAKLAWSHAEHIIELTPAEAEELLRLSGFDQIHIRGVWLCYDPPSQKLLPLLPLQSPAQWRYTRRIEAATDRPADSFVWWAEARKSSRPPDPERVAARVQEIYAIAWPERIQRFSTHIGTVSPDRQTCRAGRGLSGALMFGPYMPLRAGAYEVTFSIAADTYGVPSDAIVGLCDVHCTSRARIDDRDLRSRDFPKHGFLEITIPFQLDKLEFGMQYRIISTGAADLTCKYSVRLVERSTPAI